jgi:hypothetical protein
VARSGEGVFVKDVKKNLLNAVPNKRLGSKIKTCAYVYM